MEQTNKDIYEILIEIPKNSAVKYEYDKKSESIHVDRFLHGTNVYPGNYGFFPNTIEDDGDPLDVIVISTHPVMSGSTMKIRIIGALDMDDENKQDTKILGIFTGDPFYNKIFNYTDLPEILLAQIVDFFQNYKNLENKKVVIKDWSSAGNAKRIVAASRSRFLQQKTC